VDTLARMPSPHRVVVIGGGFGGLQAALKLAARPEVAVTLVDRRNFHLFQPLAYQVATGALAPGEICYPLRAIFRGKQNVRVLLAEVTGFDLAARRVELGPAEPGQPVPGGLEYDSLVVAGGAAYNYFGHEEWRPDAPELKSLEGALDIRRRIFTALESAEIEEDPARREAWLTFVIVGAGPTGVEMAGQIAEIARDTRRDFRVADTAKARVLLVETTDKVLGAFPPSLSKAAAEELETLGVTLLLGHTVTGITAETVTVAGPDGEETLGAHTAVWAAGVTASALARTLADAAGAETDRAGRVLVEPDLSVPGHPEVLALGDMVAVRDGQGGVQRLPGVAPVAMQEGRYAARTILGRLAGAAPRPFRYKDKGNLATIGRARAVADLHVVRLHGFPAWVSWLAIHIWYLIGFQNRILVVLRWAFSFLTHGRGARLIGGRSA
jgi:NADH dehydrogenase